MLITKTHCPGCRIQFTSGSGFTVGQTIQCPKCCTNFTVEQPAPAKAAPVVPPKPAPARAAPAPPPKPAPARVAPVATSGPPKPVKTAPRASKQAGRTPRRRSLLPVVLLGLLVVGTGVGGYLLYKSKLKDGSDTAIRVDAPAPAPVVAPTPAPVVPVVPAIVPVPKGDAPGPGATTPGGKSTDPVTPPVTPTPMPAPPVTPVPIVAVAPPPRPILPPPPAPPGSLPRRLLFVQVSKYLYLNPLSNPPDRTRLAAQALADRWDVPTARENNQLFVLSDTLPAPDGRHLVKSVVETALQRFFETSRAQDRVVVYFGGHVLERGGKAYLAPVEGDPDDVATLIPLDDFFAGLGACKASQKVVVWDVCRYNPRRGRLRPGGEPMSPALYAALTAAPPGVEVIVTCRPGENALEFFSAPSGASAPYSGSLFLEALRSSTGKRPKGAKAPAPPDPLPIAELSHDLTLRVAELAKLSPPSGTPTQTVGVAGRARNDPTPHDPAEPIAERFELPNLPPGAAPLDEVTALVREFTVPPIRADAGDTSLADAPYRADALKDYAPDVPIEEILKDKEKYPFRVAVIESLEEVRSLWKPPGKAGGLRVRDSIPAPVTEAVKQQLKGELDAWAVGIAKLELLTLKLDELSKERAAQPSRWQAHYDYARAVLKARLAYMHEYNLVIGNVITDTLPELDAKLGHDAYTLVPIETAKMKSKKVVKQLATDGAELFEKLATERKGTPWAVQARRDRAVPLGLSWQPTATKGPPAP